MKAVGVDPPEREERLGVDLQHNFEVAPGAAPGVPARVHHLGRRRFETAAESRKLGADVKPVSDEGVALTRGYGCGDNGAVSQVMEPVAQ